MTDPRVDVVRYPSGELKAVPAGKGRDIARGQDRRVSEVLSDRLVLAAAAVAVVGGAGLGLLVVAYSVLVTRTVLLGFVAGTLLFGVAALLVAAVVAVRWVQTREAELLDAGVSLQDAHEQWGARPVSAVGEVADELDGRDHEAEPA